jgi:NIPSNAP
LQPRVRIDYAPMRNKVIVAIVLILSGFAVGRASQPAPAHIYELRTYTAAEGKLDNVVARFRDHTVRIFERHHMKSVGYWLPSEGPMAGKTLVYILEHPNREEARKNWAEFSADPEWQKVKAESEVNGPILAKSPESVFMNATDFSAIK